MSLNTRSAATELQLVTQAVYNTEFKSLCLSVNRGLNFLYQDRDSSQTSGSAIIAMTSENKYKQGHSTMCTLTDKIFMERALAIPKKDVRTSLWLEDPFILVGKRLAKKQNLVKNLEWTPEQTMEVRLSLSTFEDDWNAQGMEAYDEL